MFYFGVDYYPEHWPESRWEIDAQMMQEAGFNVARLAEFAWSVLEPRDGEFDFGWLDRAIAVLAQHGIKACSARRRQRHRRGCGTKFRTLRSSTKRERPASSAAAASTARRTQRTALMRCGSHGRWANIIRITRTSSAGRSITSLAARARNGRARVGEVNRAVNLAIRPVSDLAQYGVQDVWSSPLMTLGSGAGDCEDYAIAKYVALSEAGMPAADLRLVLVHDNAVNQGHMVAAARLDGRWLILDNRTMRLVADSEVPNLTPLAALGGGPTSAGDRRRARPVRAPAEARETAGLPVVL